MRLTNDEAIEILTETMEEPNNLPKELIEAFCVAVDALKADVVYCKDCQHLGIKDGVYGYCRPYHMSGIVNPKDFCSKGVRRYDFGRTENDG